MVSCVELVSFGHKQREKASVAPHTGGSCFLSFFVFFSSAVVVIIKTSAPRALYKKPVLSPLSRLLVDRNAELNHYIQNLS